MVGWVGGWVDVWMGGWMDGSMSQKIKPLLANRVGFGNIHMTNLGLQDGLRIGEYSISVFYCEQHFDNRNLFELLCFVLMCEDPTFI